MSGTTQLVALAVYIAVNSLAHFKFGRWPQSVILVLSSWILCFTVGLRADWPVLVIGVIAVVPLLVVAANVFVNHQIRQDDREPAPSSRTR